MDNARRVTKYYPFLNLDFLDEKDQDKDALNDGVLAPKAEIIRNKGVVNAHSTLIVPIFFLLFIKVSITGQSRRDGHFVVPSSFSLSIINKIFWFFLTKYCDSMCMVMNAF